MSVHQNESTRTSDDHLNRPAAALLCRRFGGLDANGPVSMGNLGLVRIASGPRQRGARHDVDDDG